MQWFKLYPLNEVLSYYSKKEVPEKKSVYIVQKWCTCIHAFKCQLSLPRNQSICYFPEYTGKV